MEKKDKKPSSYRYYTLADLKKICGIDHKNSVEMLEPVSDVMPSELLSTTLKRNLQLPMINEKAKSELIVMPILIESWAMNTDFKPISGATFNVDPSRGLKGVADFLISKNPNAKGIESPIVAIFEAKDDKLESWYGQCGAEMYAARIFNEREGNNIKIIYGAITNGISWQFLRLEKETLHIDTQYYSIANMPQLLGAIQKIYNFYK